MAKKAAPKHQRSVTAADNDIGRRIRLLRVEQKMSQEELGKKLGVSFQQVQKYEKGVNRVGASRLQQIAGAFGVPVSLFYEGENKTAREYEGLLFQDSAFTVRLLKAYHAIQNTAIQRQMVTLMETCAAENK